MFPNAPTLALTATASDQMVTNLKDYLCFNEKLRLVRVSPNRKNLHMNIKKRLPSNYGIESYDDILRPLAEKLKEVRENFPMTVVYMKLRYCAYAYNLFRTMISNFYVDNCIDPSYCLFAEFHAESTKKMKQTILNEIKKENSNIRILFATTALGMGVDAPNIVNVIHISPPANMESYLQEIGRAGRMGQQAKVTLYYNNSDINGLSKVNDTMKSYCKETGCLRLYILNYFGFPKSNQEECCGNCDIIVTQDCGVERNLFTKARLIDNETKNKLKSKLIELAAVLPTSNNVFIPTYNLTKEDIEMIITNCEYITSERDILMKYNVWDESVCKTIYEMIEQVTQITDL